MLAQIIGFFALIFYILGIQQNNKKTLLQLQALSNITYAIQYILLNAISAACMNMSSLLASIIFYYDSKNKRKTSKLILGIFIIAISITGFLTFDGYYSLIPIIMTVLYIVSIWQNNMTFIRISIFLVSLTYIYYNIIVGAYVAIIGSIISLISAVIAIIRFDIKKDNQER